MNIIFQFTHIRSQPLALGNREYRAIVMRFICLVLVLALCSFICQDLDQERAKGPFRSQVKLPPVTTSLTTQQTNLPAC